MATSSARDQEIWTQIFKLYKELPHLWDKNNVNYGNRKMMTDGYKILTRVYRDKVDKNASVSMLRTKMKNLRTTYYRELRKVKAAKKIGKFHSPSLWYYEILSFLGNPSRSNKPATEAIENDKNQDSAQLDDLLEDPKQTDQISSNSDNDDDPIPSTSYSKDSRMLESRKMGPMERQDPLSDNSQKKLIRDGHWEIIGKSIGYQLKELNTRQYTIVSKLISDAIFFGRLNKLTEVSHIELGLTPFTEPIPGFHTVEVPTNQQDGMVFKHEEIDNDDL